MKLRCLPWFKLFVLSTLFAALATVSQAGAAEPTGPWKFQIEMEGGTQLDAVVVFKKDGDKLGGTFNLMEQAEGEFSDVKIDGKNMSFKVEIDFAGQSLAADFSGELDGDKFEGEVAYDLDGQTGTLPVVGARDVKIVATGDWDLKVVTDDGQALESKMTIVEKDGKLSAKFVGMDGTEGDVDEITLKDNKLEAKVKLDFAGTELVAEFSGEIEGSAVKGSVAYDLGGQTGEFDFEGQRRAPAAVGSWDLQVVTDDGQAIESVLTVTEADGKLAGTFVGMDGTEGKIDELTSVGETLKAKVVLDFGGTELVADFTGEIKGDKVKGTVAYDLGGQAGELDFEGQRKKAAALGKWNLVVNTDDGASLESSLTITEENGKLVGKFVGQDGSEGEVDEITASGKEVKAKVTLDFGGTELVAEFTGEIDGDDITGTVAYDLGGQAGELEFEGSRDAAAAADEKE
jgi:hypothetical protein